MGVLRKSLAVTMAVFGVAAALGACGGGDDGGDSDKTDVEDTVKELVNSSDPDKCTKTETPKFREQTRFEKDPAEALESCQRNARSNQPSDSIDFGDVSVDGDSAEATFTPDGGDLEGITATVSLVKQGDRWKLDEVTEVSIDDRAAFDAGQKEGLTGPPNARPADEADCYIRELGKRSDTDIEQAFESGDGSIFRDALRSCVGAAGGGAGGDNTARARFERLYRKELVSPPRAVTAAQADCIVKRVTEEATDSELEAVLSGKPSPSFTKKARAAGEACAGAG